MTDNAIRTPTAALHQDTPSTHTHRAPAPRAAAPAARDNSQLGTHNDRAESGDTANKRAAEPEGSFFEQLPEAAT